MGHLESSWVNLGRFKLEARASRLEPPGRGLFFVILWDFVTFCLSGLFGVFFQLFWDILGWNICPFCFIKRILYVGKHLSTAVCICQTYSTEVLLKVTML